MRAGGVGVWGAWALLGWEGAAEAASQCTRAQPGIVINELLANPASTDTDLEWVEIRNGTGQAADLSGWTVAAGTSSYGDSDPLPPGTGVPAGGYLVVGQTAIPEADVVAPGFSLGNASSNADAVQLRDCTGAVSDTVVYGAPNSDGWLDDFGAIAASLGPEPPDGSTMGRDPDGLDTDQSGLDVVALPYPTPGEANDAPPETCGGPGSRLVVNEIFPDPDGSDDGFEWIELYYAGSAPLDVSGWAVQMGTSSAATKYTFEAGKVLAPGDRFLLGGTAVVGADAVASGLSLGNASSNADIVRVVDCLGFPADTLIYGEPNTDAFADDSGQVATSLAPVPGSGESLQRLEDGYDTDQCGADFAVTAEPTPGAPNPTVEPVVCVPSVGGVVVNEILPDPDGSDDGLEWVELYNATDAAVSLAGWSLAVETDGGAVELPSDAVIAPRGFWVLAGSDVSGADAHAAFSIGNGTDTDAIALFDCAGTRVDTVLYGEAPNDDLQVDDNGQVVDPYGEPGSDESLARVTDGVDTDSADDWKIVGVTTMGASNAGSVSEGDSSTVQPRGGGCLGPKDPQPGNPNGGCAIGGFGSGVGPGVGWAGVAGLLAAIRRRPTRIRR